jgi:N-acetylmuramoyl-L-alanine amidase
MMFKLIGLAFTFILFSGVQTLTAQSVTGLGGWDVFIDPGHSQTENMGVHNYSEAQKVLQVALNLKQILLENTDVDTVYVSRLNDNVVVSLSQRTDYANSLNADFYHSIHSDAGSSTAETTLLLWGGWFQGGNTSNPIVEKTPNGGQAMGDFMTDYLTKGMRVSTRGSFPDRRFYMSGTANQWPYLHVNRASNMASVLSEGGFHTNPVQNTKNMNAEYKRLEAQTHFWSYLSYHGKARPKVGIVTGIITDVDTGLPINGATATIGELTYTTDTYESLFNKYSSDPEQLHNGFYYIEQVPTDAEAKIIFSAKDYYSDTLSISVLNDTTFNFADIQLYSSLKPSVAAVSPTDGNNAVEPTDVIGITFSKKMNKISCQEAFSIVPSVEGQFTWSNDFRMVFTPNANIQFVMIWT